jgi:hypothetical protein
MNVPHLLAGVVEPNLKSAELITKYGEPHRRKWIKKNAAARRDRGLSPAPIEHLSGFRTTTIEEIKKK